MRAEGLDFSYGQGDARNQVLFDISHRDPAGQLVVMTGPSGSGKTTLLTLIGGLRTLQEGRLEILGQDVSRLGASRAGAGAARDRLHLSDAQSVRTR